MELGFLATLLNSLTTYLREHGYYGIYAALLALGIYFGFKKINNDSRQLESTIHEKQINSLLSQLNSLTENLVQVRNQLTEIHTQNVELMRQLREAKLRVQELETMFLPGIFKNKTIRSESKDPRQ